MKVALETNEMLEVALVDGERIIGTLSLEVKGLTGTSRAGRPAGSSKSSATAGQTKTGKKRKARKPMSEESKARMAAAQKARWDKKRAAEGGGQG